MRALVINVLSSFLVCLFCQNLKAQQVNNHFVDGEIYVKLKANRLNANQVFANDQVDFLSEIPALHRTILNKGKQIMDAKRPFFSAKDKGLRRVLKLKVDDGQDILDLIESLKDDPTIEYAEPVYKRSIIGHTTATAPSDPSYVNQWFLDRVRAEDAWAANAGGGTVVVAVVDNAIDTNHVDLKGNLLPGFDVADNDLDPNPPNANFSHGTHVSGIVSAVTNNAIGIASAANNKIKVLPIKATYDISSYRSIDEGYEGIEKAIEQGVDIISLSWGGEGYSQTEQDVINHAYEQGILVLAAAGNESNDILQYPASYDHVVSVAALDDDDQLSSFSSYGNAVDISAPGRGILSTIPFNTYANFNGTSMATPLVASCAGYLLSCFPTLSPDSLEYVLKSTSDDISAANPSKDGQVGAGCVNLYRAVACRNTNLFSVNPIVSPSNFFCQGDTVQLSVAELGSESFEWISEDVVLGNEATFAATQVGAYVLKRTDGDCVLESDPIYLVRNQTQSAPPSVLDTSLAYCQPQLLSLMANVPACAGYGPQTFSYTGPTVGFDGFSQSNEYPSLEVSGIGGLIDSVSVSITWEKKDGGDYNSCGVASGGGKPFNDEISFKLISPEGLEILLLEESTYASGASSSGVVTTIFTAHGTSIPDDSDPVSGIFRAAGDLSVLENRISQGTWTLVALDAYYLDPLCVSGFSLTVKSKEPINAPEVQWYSDITMNEVIGSGNSLALSALEVGAHAYYATVRCEGLCESAPAKATVSVRPVPDLFAFSRSTVNLTAGQVYEIMHAQSVDYSVTDNLYTVFGINAGGQAFSYQVSDQAPLVSPISLCASDDFLLFGLHCNGTITWSSGETGPAIQMMNVSEPVAIAATCNQTWDCTPLSDIGFEFTAPSAAIVIGGEVLSHSQQGYYGDGIESTQIIQESSHIDYRAPSSILLKPGFQTESSTVFQANIGECP
ncbi:S8 family serine peptidase [Marinilongibacter aquaticus]|uniref:S8 family serine peptidase n=1 Tax=Marinilongibacter aquaticus TaxID=2975157 RepID=UPI0021BD85AB|nr:S8 family serine peptidase [Marinilongibacter aquaticus]UBM59219.1 S8 family serine peptidase [Marinilongibacter aquaticus]